MKIWKKITLGFLLFLFLVIMVVMLLLPSAIKDYVEENDRELIGREIHIEDININYWTFTITVEGFHLKELNTNKDFVSFKKLMADFQFWDLFSNSIFVREYSIDGLFVNIEQDNEAFNFDDLMRLGESDSTSVNVDGEDSAEWHFTIQNFKLNSGSISYKSDLLEKIQFDSIFVSVPLLSDTSIFVESFVHMLLSTGGELRLNNLINLEQSEYNVEFMANDLNMSFLGAYLEPYLKFSDFEGVFHADFQFSGNWDNTDIFNIGGSSGISNFLLTNQRKETVMSLKSSELSIDTIQMAEGVYNIEFLHAKGFYALYEMYDESDNFSDMMVSSANTIDSVSVDSASTSLEGTGEPEIDYSNPFAVMGYYLKDIAQSYKKSSYRVGELKIENSALDFNDYTPNTPFRYQLTEMSLVSKFLNSENETISFKFGSVLDHSGRFDGSLDLYTDNLENLDLHYSMRGTQLTPFSPYTSTYVNYPIVLGDVVYECDVKIRDGIIDSQNIITCNQFNFGKKLDGSALYNLPVKLAVSLLKDIDGNIHLDIPIDGDLNDPNYRIGKVIWSTVKNLLLKAVTAPYKLLASTFGFDEEEIKRIDFGLLQMRLSKDQEKQLNNLTKVLMGKPDLNVEFKRVTKKFEAVESYAISEAKYQYLHNGEIADITEISEDEYTELLNLDLRDSLFMEYVDSRVSESDRELPIQRKCLLMVGEEHATAIIDKVGTVRGESIESYLISEKKIDVERIRFKILPEDSLITNRSNSVYNVGFWVDE